MTIEVMATTEVSPDSSLFGAIAASIKAAALRRRRRIALAELMRMSPARLEDLGLEQQDVLFALNEPAPAAPRLRAKARWR